MTVEAFDQFLAGRGLRLVAVLIGGTALNLLGIVSRPTKDCDVLSPTLPAEVINAARAFASEVRSRGGALDDDWLNNGPASLVRELPRAGRIGCNRPSSASRSTCARLEGMTCYGRSSSRCATEDLI